MAYAVATDAPRVALTPDGGPDAAGIPAILDTLTRHGARVTFFVLGERVPGREALVRRMVVAGNEIGNHGNARGTGHGPPARSARARAALLPALSRKGLAAVTPSDLWATSTDAAPRSGGISTGCSGAERGDS